MTAAIIHPRMVTSLPAGFFPSLATVQAKTVVEDEYGQETETFTDVAAWTNIPAAKAPLSAIERQVIGYTATDQAWHVLLRGAYPEITTRHQIVVDGEAFDVDAVETDQTQSLTRLRVRTVGT